MELLIEDREEIFNLIMGNGERYRAFMLGVREGNFVPENIREEIDFAPVPLPSPFGFAQFRMEFFNNYFHVEMPLILRDGKNVEVYSHRYVNKLIEASNRSKSFQVTRIGDSSDAVYLFRNENLRPFITIIDVYDGVRKSMKEENKIIGKMISYGTRGAKKARVSEVKNCEDITDILDQMEKLVNLYVSCCFDGGKKVPGDLKGKILTLDSVV